MTTFSAYVSLPQTLSPLLVLDKGHLVEMLGFLFFFLFFETQLFLFPVTFQKNQTDIQIWAY